MKSVGLISIVVLLFLQINVFAGKIEKGYERLKLYDYFNAKKYFENELEDETAPAAYGLSLIHTVKSNPFYNIDEAQRYILLADSAYKRLKEKKKKEYIEFGVTDSAISTRAELICKEAFGIAKTNGTVHSLNHFIRNFSACNNYPEVYALRDSVAFEDAMEKNTSLAYKEYMVMYPQTVLYKQALSKYEESVFNENTTDNKVESYENFIRDFPENSFRQKAEENIYSLSTPNKQRNEFISFVRKYKSSPFSKSAWREIYKLTMKDYTMDSYNNFKDSFPDYPFQEEFEYDFQLQNYFFLPFKEGGLWGYMNEFGKEMIEPIYEDASFFSDGFASVAQNGNYGYISKSGNVAINFRYKDAEAFHNGFAIVMKDSLYGLIDKNGETVIQHLYDELSETEKDIFIAAKKDKYGYIKRNGTPVTPFDFDLANDFINGLAIISKVDKYGLINSQGQYVIPPVFDEIVYLNDTLFKALNDDEKWGLLNYKSDTILPFIYDAIGEFSEHRLLIAKNGKCGYVDEFGSIVIPISYTYSSALLTTGQFKNGYASVRQKERSMLIDTTGKIFKLKDFDECKRPGLGLVPVRKMKKWGYADMDGKIRIPCTFESVEPFNDVYAVFRKGKIEGLIDTMGNVFIQPLYDEIILFPNAIQVKSNEKWGLLSRSGLLYIPCNYEMIEFLSPKLVSATEKLNYTYINLQTGKIIFSPQD